jgi:hypothetical protein
VQLKVTSVEVMETYFNVIAAIVSAFIQQHWTAALLLVINVISIALHCFPWTSSKKAERTGLCFVYRINGMSRSDETKHTPVLGAFAILRKATVSFVMSVHPLAWNNSAATGRILMKLDILRFFKKSVENSDFIKIRQK